MVSTCRLLFDLGWNFMAALAAITVVREENAVDHCGQRRQFFLKRNKLWSINK